MPGPVTPFSDCSGSNDAARAQTWRRSHWTLLDTRSITWAKIFSRVAMFLTVLSAAVASVA